MSKENTLNSRLTVGDRVTFTYDRDWKLQSPQVDCRQEPVIKWFDRDGALVDIAPCEPGQSVTFKTDLVGRVINEQRDDGTSRHYTYSAEDDICFKHTGRLGDHCAGPPNETKKLVATAFSPRGSAMNEPSLAVRWEGAEFVWHSLAQVKREGARESDFDAVGNRTQMIDRTGTTTYAFDSLNRMIGKTDPGSLVQAYGFDAASQRTKLVDPDGGIRTSTLDLDGRLQTFVDSDSKTTTLQYDNAARRTHAIYPSGASRTWTYDVVGQLTGVLDVNAAGTQLLRLTPTYDSVGNRTGIRDSNGALVTYQYDGKNRLTEDATSGINTHTYDYSYDGTDNRLTSTETGFTTTATYDFANRLQTSVDNTGTSTFTYDSNGNLTKVVDPTGTTTMSYDKENRLAVHQNAGVTTSYLYDGDGLKRVEIVAGIVTTLLWDGSEYLGEV